MLVDTDEENVEALAFLRETASVRKPGTCIYRGIWTSIPKRIELRNGQRNGRNN